MTTSPAPGSRPCTRFGFSRADRASPQPARQALVVRRHADANAAAPYRSAGTYTRHSRSGSTAAITDSRSFNHLTSARLDETCVQRRRQRTQSLQRAPHSPDSASNRAHLGLIRDHPAAVAAFQHAAHAAHRHHSARLPAAHRWHPRSLMPTARAGARRTAPCSPRRRRRADTRRAVPTAPARHPTGIHIPRASAYPRSIAGIRRSRSTAPDRDMRRTPPCAGYRHLSWRPQTHQRPRHGKYSLLGLRSQPKDHLIAGHAWPHGRLTPAQRPKRPAWSKNSSNASRAPSRGAASRTSKPSQRSQQELHQPPAERRVLGRRCPSSPDSSTSLETDLWGDEHR